MKSVKITALLELTAKTAHNAVIARTEQNVILKPVSVSARRDGVDLNAKGLVKSILLVKDADKLAVVKIMEVAAQ